MNVLVISHMYPSSSNMVMGIFVHKIVKKLIEKGCNVKVVCPVPYVPYVLKDNYRFKKFYSIPLKDNIDGVEVYYPRYLDFPRGLFLENSGYFMYWGIKNTIERISREFKIDVIHAHTVIPVGFSAMLLNEKYNVPVVVTIHGQDFQYTISKNEACRRNEFKVLGYSDSIITVSNKLKNIIKEESFIDKVTVINNGINPEEFEVDEDIECEFDSSRTLLSVSGLIKTKGIDINLRAVSKLKEKYPDIKYYIIGSGEEENYLRRLTEELNLVNNVIFLGRLPHKEVMKYMAKAGVLVLPSWLEGFGIVYIEAMAHGLPVIAVRGQGIEDVIIDGENGFLVEPKNVDDVVRVLSCILDNPDKAKDVGLRAKEIVLNNFTWLRNAEKTINIYENLIRKNKNV
jgi:teichuronic acid biosynthesis glycosyltransferase TuaC